MPDPPPQPMSRPRVWIVTDGAAGNLRQAEALAERLGAIERRIVVDVARPWRWLAPRRLPLAGSALGAEFTAALAAAAPRLAIGCGRQAALATRLLRERGVPVVQLLAPGIRSTHWDLVVTPRHDGVVGDNIVTTLGSLHPIDAPWLERARQAWPQFGELPAPRSVLLLGGPTAAAPFAERDWQRLRDRLRQWLRSDGGSLLLSSSRRTPPWLRDAARRDLGDLPGRQWHAEADGPNPYAGMLGWADRIVVTADSVNLLSEACATTAPVHSLLPSIASGRLGRFHRLLLDCGRLTPLDSTKTTAAVTPLREADTIAAEVAARLGLAPAANR